MNGRRLALPTLLATLLGVGAAALRVDVGEADAGSPLAAKLAAAERTIVYAITPASGPHFRLVGGAETLLLIAHLQLPPDAPAVAEQIYRFGVVATLRGPDGAALHTWTLTRRTRQTKAGPLGGGAWAHEPAFVPDGRLQLSDGGGIELELPACPPDSTLEIRMADEAGPLAAGSPELLAPFAAPAALIRVYRSVPVDPAERDLRALRLANDAGAHRLGGATYLPWYALRPDQQLHRLGRAWERLAPEGHAGADYRNYSIYVAAERPPEPPELVEPAIEVGAGQPAIVHLRGPAIVLVRARLADPAVDPAALELRARWLGPLADPPGDMPPGTSPQDPVPGAIHRPGPAPPAGLPPRPDPSPARPALDPGGDLSLTTAAPETLRGLALPAGGEWQAIAVPVPAGWTALELHSDAARVQTRVFADDVAAHAGPDRHERHRGPDGRPFVPVDLQTRHAYRAGPTRPPLLVDLSGPADVYSRVLRLDARAPGEPRPIPLRVEFLDAGGRSLAALDEVLLPAGPDPFERMRGASPVLKDTSVGSGPIDPVSTDMQEDAGFPLGEGPVSAAASLRLLAPPGALRARISALAPALIELHGQLPPADDAAESPWIWPYDQISAPGERWRHAPRRRAAWFPLRADDHPARLAAGEVVLLIGQLRRAPLPAPATGAGPWRAEHPRGSHPRVRLLERVPPERRAETLAQWGPGRYTGLRRGAAVELDLGRGAPRPPRLLYQLTGASTAALGATLAVKTDDREERWRITGRAGQRALPGGRARAALTWTEGPGEVLLLVDRPPLSAAPIYERRQLHRLGPGGLTLQVDKPSADPLVVNAVLYWLDGAPREPSELRITVDGGSPRRRAATAITRVTPGSRRLDAAPTERADLLFTDRRGEARVAVQRVALALGDDIAPGPHSLRIELADGPPVWLRLFRHGTPRPARGVWQWNERRSGAMIMEDSDEEDE